MSWALGLSVFAPIPKKEHWPLKLHGFLNGGKVVAYDTCTSSLLFFSLHIADPYRSERLCGKYC